MQETLTPQEDKNDEDEIFYIDGKVAEGYSDNEILEYTDRPVPQFLKYSYILLPIWGIIWLYLFWNGSWGWFDRGYWHTLQQAANTTFVTEDK